MEAAFAALEPEERLRLLRFVCSFAWADLDLAEEERTFITELMGRMELDESEQDQVDDWISRPPEPESVDPTEIPREHRQIFLKTVLELVMADGVVDASEVESFALFEQLLR